MESVLQCSALELLRRSSAASTFAEAAGSVNPWADAADKIRNSSPFVNPPVWFHANLGTVGIILVVSAGLHLLAIIIPSVRGKTMRMQHLWLVHSKSVGSDRRYIIPNGRLFSSISSLACCIVLCITVGLLLFAPIRANDCVYGIAYLLLFVQYWLCAFDALFADALVAVWATSPDERKTFVNRLRHPWVLNSLCWAVPTVMTIMTAVITAMSWTKFNALNDAKNNLLAALDAAAQEYDSQVSISSAATIAELTARVSDALNDYLSFGKVSALSFAIWMALALLLFTMSLGLLGRMVIQGSRTRSNRTLAASDPGNASATQASVTVVSRTFASQWQCPEEWKVCRPGQEQAATSACERGRAPKTTRFARPKIKWGGWHWLAAFLLTNVFLLLWFTVGLFLLAFKIRQLVNDPDLTRRSSVITAWPVGLTMLLMGVLGVVRTCEREPSAGSEAGVVPSRIAATVRRRSAARHGLFADVGNEDDVGDSANPEVVPAIDFLLPPGPVIYS